MPPNGVDKSLDPNKETMVVVKLVMAWLAFVIEVLWTSELFPHTTSDRPLTNIMPVDAITASLAKAASLLARYRPRLRLLGENVPCDPSMSLSSIVGLEGVNTLLLLCVDHWSDISL